MALAVAPSAYAIGSASTNQVTQAADPLASSDPQTVPAQESSPTPEATSTPSPETEPSPTESSSPSPDPLPESSPTPEPGPAPEPSPSQTPTESTERPDRDALVVTSSGRPSAVAMGERVDYTITLKNTHDLEFTGVTVIDLIPFETDLTTVGRSAPYEVQSTSNRTRIIWTLDGLAGGDRIDLSWSGKVVRKDDGVAINRIRILVEDRNTTTTEDTVRIEVDGDGSSPGGEGGGDNPGAEGGSGKGPSRGNEEPPSPPAGPQQAEPNAPAGSDNVAAGAAAQSEGRQLPFTGMPLFLWLATGGLIGSSGFALKLLTRRTEVSLDEHVDLVIPEPEEPRTTAGYVLVYDRIKEMAADVQALRALRLQIESGAF